MAVELKTDRPNTTPDLTTLFLDKNSSTSLKLVTFEELCQQAIIILRNATTENPVLKIQIEEECIDPPDNQPLPILEETLPDGKIGHPLSNKLELNNSLRTPTNRDQSSNIDITPQRVSALVEKASQGSDTAFGYIYQFYVNKIYNYVYYKVSHRADAEDITEQIFLKTWEAVRRGRFVDQDVPFDAWLFKVARNAVIDRYRIKKSDADLSEIVEAASPEGNPEEIVQRKATTGMLMTAIGRLTEDQQQVIIMRFVDGMNSTEISNAIGKKKGTIRALQHRGLLSLQRILSDERYGLIQERPQNGNNHYNNSSVRY